MSPADIARAAGSGRGTAGGLLGLAVALLALAGVGPARATTGTLDAQGERFASDLVRVYAAPARETATGGSWSCRARRPRVCAACARWG